MNTVTANLPLRCPVPMATAEGMTWNEWGKSESWRKICRRMTIQIGTGNQVYRFTPLFPRQPIYSTNKRIRFLDQKWHIRKKYYDKHKVAWKKIKTWGWIKRLTSACQYCQLSMYMKFFHKFCMKLDPIKGYCKIGGNIVVTWTFLTVGDTWNLNALRYPSGKVQYAACT